ncbi:MAG: PilN domain-containing protein [Candidatus Omnitrophica bacterium]|nr:PilN domain-containing protein [Candidatus Omnitrophota bacterium]
MKNKKNLVFVFEHDDAFFRIAKVYPEKKTGRIVVDDIREYDTGRRDASGSENAGEISRVFREFGYEREEVIVSLPRDSVTIRYSRIPSLSSREIENILQLQASTYLPYPNADLITAYQLIRQDRDGYSDINCIVIHRDSINRLINVLHSAGISRFKIIVSSFGFLSFYTRAGMSAGGGAVMFLERGVRHEELVIGTRETMVFSRTWNIAHKQDVLGQTLEEIRKSIELYRKEISPQAPQKLVVFNAGTNAGKFSENAIPGCEIMYAGYSDVIAASPEVMEKISRSAGSWIHILGAGITAFPESAYVLPADLKQKSLKEKHLKELMKAGSLLCLVFLILFAGITRHFENKKLYLNKLKDRIKQLEKEAIPLEQKEKRLALLSKRRVDSASVLSVLTAITSAVPEDIKLTELTYENGEVFMRGESSRLESVLNFVNSLEKLPRFKNNHISMNHASAKNAETVLFEISSRKRK